MTPKNATSRDSHHDAPTVHRSCEQQPSIIRACAPLVGLRNVRPQNQSKNITTIDRRSIPGDASGHPKSTQNRSRDPLGRPRDVQERPEPLGSVPERPQRPPGGRQGRLGMPARTPWSAWERAEATKIDAKSRPRAEKLSFLRAAHSQSIAGGIFGRFSLIFAFSAKSANS